jgi:hypothetical protein
MKVFVFRSVDAQKEVFPTELTLKYTVSKVQRTQIGHISAAVLWIRVLSDPHPFGGSGSVTISTKES